MEAIGFSPLLDHQRFEMPTTDVTKTSYIVLTFSTPTPVLVN
jgi:hypothetical protein